MIWSPEREFFAFTCGSIVCVEELKTGKQNLLHNHHEDITVLSMRNDCFQMASSSAYTQKKQLDSINTTPSELKSKQSLITIWSCEAPFKIVINLFHKNSSIVTCMNYSTDDRFLISIGDFKTPSLTIWNTYDYTSLVNMDSLNYIIYDVAWNPCKCNEFTLCGQSKMLAVWSLDEKPMKICSLRSSEMEVPLILCEVI
jgi:hypothetical protein